MLLWILVSVVLPCISCPPVSAADEAPGKSKVFRIAAYKKLREDGVTVIHLPSGIFSVEKTVFLPSNCVLEGSGPQTVLAAPPSFTGSRFITNKDAQRGNANITIRNIKIDFNIRVLKGSSPGVMYFENVDGLFIDSVTMKIDSDLYGIDLAGAVRRSRIEKCTITNTGNGGGIMVRNRNTAIPTADVSVGQNTITSSRTDEPLAVFGWLGRVQNVVLEDNRIIAGGASFGITVYGIDEPGHTGSAENVRVSKNEVRGGKVGGIAVKGGARKITVCGNTINGQSSDGVFLHSGGKSLPDVADIAVRENNISNVGRHCIFAAGKNIAVESNQIMNCGQSGIYVGGKVSVLKNRIANAKPGIIVDTDAPKVIEGNTLTGSSSIRVFNNDYSGIANNVIKEK